MGKFQLFPDQASTIAPEVDHLPAGRLHQPVVAREPAARGEPVTSPVEPVLSANLLIRLDLAGGQGFEPQQPLMRRQHLKPGDKRE